MVTGVRAAAPAEVFQAAAVIPTERRCGTITPCPPNAATERMIAPRLRGSVTPSSATSNGTCPREITLSSSSSGCVYSYGGTLSASPWCTESKPAIRSSSGRITSRIGRPRLVASDMTSLTRSSYSIRVATYRAVAGMRARSASSTELRPVTISNSSPVFGRRPPC